MVDHSKIFFGGSVGPSDLTGKTIQILIPKLLINFSLDVTKNLKISDIAEIINSFTNVPLNSMIICAYDPKLREKFFIQTNGLVCEYTNLELNLVIMIGSQKKLEELRKLPGAHNGIESIKKLRNIQDLSDKYTHVDSYIIEKLIEIFDFRKNNNMLTSNNINETLEKFIDRMIYSTIQDISELNKLRESYEKSQSLSQN